MLTSAQLDSIREHFTLDERIASLISLANHDLYEGPIDVDSLGDEHEWPGFVTACEMIADAMPTSDLWLDDDIVLGDSEPEEMHEMIVRVDSRAVVRALVGRELAQYV